MWSFPVHPPCWLQLFGVAHEDQTRFYPKWIQMARKGRKHKWWVWEFWNLKSWEIQSDNFSHEKFWNLENYKWKYKAHEFSVLRNSFSVLRNIFLADFCFFFKKIRWTNWSYHKLSTPQPCPTTNLPVRHGYSKHRFKTSRGILATYLAVKCGYSFWNKIFKFR